MTHKILAKKTTFLYWKILDIIIIFNKVDVTLLTNSWINYFWKEKKERSNGWFGVSCQYYWIILG